MIAITDVRIKPYDNHPLKAFVSVTLCEEWVIKGLKIIEASDGHLFVAMPSKVKKAGGYQDIVHPITRESREHLEEIVLNAYDDIIMEASCYQKEDNS